MTNRQTLNMIGLAMRAGKLASGAFQVNKALEAGTVQLILIDETASENTVADLKHICEVKGVQTVVLNKDELAQAIGRPGRMVAAILDINFSRKINDLIHGGV